MHTESIDVSRVWFRFFMTKDVAPKISESDGMIGAERLNTRSSFFSRRKRLSNALLKNSDVLNVRRLQVNNGLKSSFDRYSEENSDRALMFNHSFDVVLYQTERFGTQGPQLLSLISAYQFELGLCIDGRLLRNVWYKRQTLKSDEYPLTRIREVRCESRVWAVPWQLSASRRVFCIVRRCTSSEDFKLLIDIQVWNVVLCLGKTTY